MLKIGLNEKVIVVTGAAAGIGWGIANVCAQAGGTVVLADIKDASQRVNFLKERGLNGNYLPLDVSDTGSIDAFIEKVIGLYGRIDGLVNNAGVTIEGDFLNFKLDDLEKLWKINQRSVFLMSQGAAPHMKPGSSIVNIASNHAVASVSGYEMYAATKGAIVAMTRAMAWSLGERGIRVNSLCPGLTKTEAVSKVIADNPKLEKSFAEMHADSKFNSVEEVGYIAAFLLSANSSAVTGSNIVADHGLSASLCPNDSLK